MRQQPHESANDYEYVLGDVLVVVRVRVIDHGYVFVFAVHAHGDENELVV